MTTNPQEAPDPSGIGQFYDTNIYYSVAEDLLSGVIPPDPLITRDLALYLREGAYAVIDPSVSRADDISSEPVSQFIDATKAELEADPTVFARKVKTWAEMKQALETVEIEPAEVVTRGFMGKRLQARRARRQAEESARLAIEQRQQELEELKRITFNEKRMPVSEFRSGDAIILMLESWGDKPDSRVVLHGRVVDHRDAEVKEHEYDNERHRVSGVAIEVTYCGRYSEREFSDDPLPTGSEILLTESSLVTNDYLSRPGNILQGDAPRIYWGDNRIRPRVTESKEGSIHHRTEHLGISLLNINGLPMFPPVVHRNT